MQIEKMEYSKEMKKPQWIEKVLTLTKKRKGRPLKRSPLNRQNEGSINS